MTGDWVISFIFPYKLQTITCSQLPIPYYQLPIMRLWNFWVNTLILSSQYNPPRFIELLMLTLAIAMLIISTITPDKPYLVLGLSLVLGASISILIREAIFTTNHAHPPSSQRLITIITSFLLLCISLYGFADLIISL